jgi:hypothetical protein
MTITLNTKEFDEAILLWLKEQGFSTDRYSISTRTIAGRSDGPLGTRIEATLEPVPELTPTTLTELDIAIATGIVTKGPSFSKGRTDENTTIVPSVPKFGHREIPLEGPVTLGVYNE